MTELSETNSSGLAVPNADDRARLYARVFAGSREGIMITDAHTRILSINPAFTAITGYEEAEVAGKRPSILKSGRQGAAFYKAMWTSVTRTGSWQGEIWNRKKSGEIYPEWLTINAVRDESGVLTNYLGMFSDMTERKHMEDHLHYLAHYDSLTGLPNRTLLGRKLDDAMERAKESGRLAGILFVSLDRFKIVYDSHGHSIGDKLLQKAAERMKASVKPSDTVSRLGGDEFVLVLENLRKPEDAEEAAYRLADKLNRPVPINELELFLDSSIGISVFPHDGADFETLVKHAEFAMYNAKEQRRACEPFTSAISDTITRRMELENELRHAQEKNQLSVCFQPQMEVATGLVSGMEALLRWHHPVLGNIPPMEFIPIAEETGMIHDIGNWVLGEACRVWSDWKREGFRLPAVAVNLSTRQFEQPDFLGKMLKTIESWGCTPQDIVFELTESGSLDEVDAVLPVFGKLKEIGSQVAIDDFGQGYSNLGYFKQFPLDLLKIDKSFLMELTTDSASVVVTKAIIDMAHGLKLRVLAEGVETKEQYIVLRALGCDEVQGYGIGMPMVPAEFRSWLMQVQASGGRAPAYVEWTESAEPAGAPDRKPSLC